VTDLPEWFGGNVPPVCTPFTEDGELDVPSLERLIGFLLGGGVHALFLLGSTSETALLTPAQRRKILEVGVATAGGQVPILAGVIDTSTGPVIEHARTAQKAGVDALVVTPPYYVRVDQAEILAHFRAIHAAVPLPIFAYDVPSNGPAKLDRATVRALAQEGTVVGLKDSSGDDVNFRNLLMESRDLPRFAAFTGSELVVDTALMLGASGCVPGLGNVDPAGYVRLYDAVRAGDMETARQEQERLIRLFRIIACGTPGRMGFTASALGGFKTSLVLRGAIATNVMGRPLTRYNDEETGRVRELLHEAELL
jgi:4-hydroxy-tetrahydrodipicolinate synthase